MQFSPEKHHRRSMRMQGWDYSSPGFYFVTIRIRDVDLVFGKICKGKFIQNVFGSIARDEWLYSAKIRKNIKLDEFVIMPDHLHGIIQFLKISRYDRSSAVQNMAVTVKEKYLRSPSGTLGAVIRGFKGVVKSRINAVRHTLGREVWQRNYYEHLIRTPEELERIRLYIKNNPKNWNGGCR